MSFEFGQKVKVINNASGHSQPIGKKFTFVGMTGNYAKVAEMPNLNFYQTDLEEATFSLKELQDEIKKEEQEIQEKESYVEILKDKITYLEETGEEAVDEGEFTSYQVAKVFANADLPISEKTKKIAATLKPRLV